MALLAPLDLSILTYPEWLNLSIAVSSALGTAREYAEQNPHYDGWYDEMLDLHYDIVSLTGKPHASPPEGDA